MEELTIRDWLREGNVNMPLRILKLKSTVSSKALS